MTDMDPVPAATVVLVREASNLGILLLQRNTKLVFHGGHWVFPGGRLDKSDYEYSQENLEYPAALRAAVRETREEAGVDIEENDLIHTAHWTTPPNQPRRFSTWFFICPLKESVSVSIDNAEILDYRWISPRQALEDAEAKKWVLPRPTMTTLSDIVDYTDLKSLISAVTGARVRVFPANSEYYRPEEMGYPG